MAGIVSFVGVSLVVIGIPGGMSKLSGEIWGILIALCIPLSWAFFSLLIGPPMKRHTPMRINAVVLPGDGGRGARDRVRLAREPGLREPDTLAWICLAYSALGTLVITNLLWFRVVGRVGAAKSSYFLNIQPFGAALLAWLLLGETITVIQIWVASGSGRGSSSRGYACARRHHSSEGTALAVGQETVTRPPRSKGFLVLLAKTSVPADSLTFQTTVPTNRAVVERLDPGTTELGPTRRGAIAHRDHRGSCGESLDRLAGGSREADRGAGQAEDEASGRRGRRGGWCRRPGGRCPDRERIRHQRRVCVADERVLAVDEVERERFHSDLVDRGRGIDAGALEVKIVLGRLVVDGERKGSRGRDA